MTWAPDYVTTAELKAYQRISDTDDDTLLALWITAACRAVDKHCGRQFGQTAAPEARTYTPQWDPKAVLGGQRGAYVTQVDDMQDVTGLTVVDKNGNAVTGYTLGPVNSVKKGRPYERILTTAYTGDLTVTVKWGWAAVPAAVKVPTMIQAARFAARRDSPYGIAGSPSEGSEMRLLATLDPDVKTSLGPFRRDWWAA